MNYHGDSNVPIFGIMNYRFIFIFGSSLLIFLDFCGII